MSDLFQSSLPTGQTWAVTTQRQSVMSDGNTFVPSVIVGFQTAQGNKGNVEVNATDYASPATVAKYIQAAAYQMDQIGLMNDTNVNSIGT